MGSNKPYIFKEYFPGNTFCNVMHFLNDANYHKADINRTHVLKEKRYNC